MNIDINHLKVFEVMTRLSIDRASRALSKTLKTGAKIALSNIYITDLTGATEKMNEDAREMAGVMVNFHGNVACKLLFMLPMAGTLILTDLFLRQPVGTAKEFDEASESAIQEVGNIIAAHICNALVSNFDATLVPLPPIVHNDYAGVLFSSLLMEQGMNEESFLLIDTSFKILKTELDCYLFLIPELKSFEKLIDTLGVCL
jgi:chemotaxis protein CheC